jgi:hypothetical protein
MRTDKLFCLNGEIPVLVMRAVVVALSEPLLDDVQVPIRS